MDIQTQLSVDGKILTITLSGDFNYTCHEPFQKSYLAIEPVPEEYVIDTLGLQSMDSSALGMLLLLRKHAGDDSANVKISNTTEDIYKLLHSCKFDELFNVEQVS